MRRTTVPTDEPLPLEFGVVFAVDGWLGILLPISLCDDIHNEYEDVGVALRLKTGGNVSPLRTIAACGSLISTSGDFDVEIDSSNAPWSGSRDGKESGCDFAIPSKVVGRCCETGLAGGVNTPGMCVGC